MLSYKTIEPNTLELLKRITALPVMSEMRLVGGTALALQYGHRQSVDLDFFGSMDADDETLREQLRTCGTLKIHSESQNIKLYFINGIKVDVVNYSYPWIEEAVKEDGLSLASPKDIAAMKIAAIEGRGTKKDFIDIDELLKHFSLSDILDFYKKKYDEGSSFRAMLSLSYFEDAELQPMPQMFTNIEWESVKNNIRTVISTFK